MFISVLRSCIILIRILVPDFNNTDPDPAIYIGTVSYLIVRKSNFFIETIYFYIGTSKMLLLPRSRIFGTRIRIRNDRYGSGSGQMIRIRTDPDSQH